MLAFSHGSYLKVCKEAGVEPPIVAAVYGDDLLPEMNKLTQKNAIKRLLGFGVCD